MLLARLPQLCMQWPSCKSTKALKDLKTGSPDTEVMQELHLATDYALRATKVMAQALGLAMSTFVIQKCQLRLKRVKMWDVEKIRFLNVPITFLVTLSKTAVLCREKQTEAIKHILP